MAKKTYKHLNPLAVEMGKRISLARKQKGLSQPQVAIMLNLSRSAFAQWETGRSFPMPDNLLQISRVLDVSVQWLYDGDADTESARAKTNHEAMHLERVRHLDTAGQLDALQIVDLLRDVSPEDREILKHITENLAARPKK
jgi:transcriptional regulator with XRE-family HTH domain